MTPSPHIIPTADLDRWVRAGWSPIRPAFDPANHTIIRWDGIGQPQEPAPTSTPEIKS